MTQATQIASPAQIALATYANMYTAAKDNAGKKVLSDGRTEEDDKFA